MNNENLVDAINRYVSGLLSEVFTIIPAVVVNTPVLYNNKPFVDVRPMIRSRRSAGDLYEFSDQFEVPLFIYSSNGGKAGVTLPIKEGDNVLLLYSQRDVENYLDGSGTELTDAVQIKPLGEYPICAIPSIFTFTTDTIVDPDNVKLMNVLSSITLKEDGNIDINGITATPEGNLITKAGTDLDELKASHDMLRAEYDLHVHTGNLGQPTSPPVV